MKLIKFLLKCITKPFQIFFFLIFYAWEIFSANLEFAYEVLTPGNKMIPGIIAVPLDIQNEFAINLLANLITMAPGTLCIDISNNRKILYVHALYIKDIKKFRSDVKRKLEKRIIKLFS